MGINAFQGLQCVGNLTLAPGTLTGNIPIWTARKTSGGYTLLPTERVGIHTIVVTSSDSANELVTITDGASGFATVLFTGYVSNVAPSTLQVPPGVLFGFPGTLLVATAGAITAAKNIVVSLVGVVVRSA